MIVTPFLAGSFDLIAGEFLASNRKTKTNVERLAHKRYLMRGLLDGRMALVPEGRSKSLSSPEWREEGELERPLLGASAI
jgi:hypothetical protein